MATMVVTALTSIRSSIARSSAAGRIATAVVVVLLAGSLAVPGEAQTTAEIDAIRQERRANEEAGREKAKEIDVASAELEQISAVLAALNASVNAQEGRVENAMRQLDDAERTLAEAGEAVAAGEAAIVFLKEQLADRAVSSFVNQGTDPVLLFETDDPNVALRMQRLVDEVTQADVDIADTLRAAEEDLAVERAIAADATLAADQLRAEMEAELGLLEEDRELQAAVTAEAEVRLDHLLSERASLAAIGVQLGQKQRAAEQALAAELARKSRGAPAGPGGPRPPVAAPGDMVNVNGILVHKSIADNIRRLMADASAAGISFSGGGYRNSAGQISVRRSNCGSSEYAIYQMPASRCRPPTARPGTSMHERGLAIDFTFNGRIINRRSGDGWNWLSRNAASYGLFNLPSEPWHWSTNGR